MQLAPERHARLYVPSHKNTDCYKNLINRQAARSRQRITGVWKPGVRWEQETVNFAHRAAEYFMHSHVTSSINSLSLFVHLFLSLLDICLPATLADARISRIPTIAKMRCQWTRQVTTLTYVRTTPVVYLAAVAQAARAVGGTWTVHVSLGAHVTPLASAGAQLSAVSLHKQDCQRQSTEYHCLVHWFHPWKLNLTQSTMRSHETKDVEMPATHRPVMI